MNAFIYSHMMMVLFFSSDKKLYLDSFQFDRLNIYKAHSHLHIALPQ